MPRRVVWDCRDGGIEPYLIENVALPKGCLAVIAESGLSNETRRALAQWELTLPASAIGQHSHRRVWPAMALRVLMRGHITRLSSDLENGLAEMVGCKHADSSENWQQTLKVLAGQLAEPPAWPQPFDSYEEQVFYERLAKQLAGRDVRAWMWPQMPLTNLVLDDDVAAFTDRRVDFLVAHPSGLKVVVEIDGLDHTPEADGARNRVLAKAGYKTIRIPASEVRDEKGSALESIRELFSGVPQGVERDVRLVFASLARRAHQLHVALLRALRAGCLHAEADGSVPFAVVWDVPVGERHLSEFMGLVSDDLNRFIEDMAALANEHSEAVKFVWSKTARNVVRFAPESISTDDISLCIRDVYLPFSIAAELLVPSSTPSLNVNPALCQRLLARLFGHPDFREGQFKAIERCLVGKDTLVLLPTGAGKSLVYQFVSLFRFGMCLVVAPLKSLIDDQVQGLCRQGITRACGLTGDLSGAMKRQFNDRIAGGEFIFCFVTPQRFQMTAFRESLRSLVAHTPISLIAIDEAHCVSEWGHGFVPAYMNLGALVRRLCSPADRCPPLVGLTGTASRTVLRDIQRDLGIDAFDAVVLPRTFDRPELHYRVLACSPEEKPATLIGHLHRLPSMLDQDHGRFFSSRGQRTASGIIFCPHVNGPYGVVKVADIVGTKMRIGAQPYSSKPPNGYDRTEWVKECRATATSYKANRFPLLVGTKAFGMGIDKPNIRYTIHYGLPPSVEAFYQEAGRAGRDRDDAFCSVLMSITDAERNRQLLDPLCPPETVRKRVAEIGRQDEDDVVQALWFHCNSFRGVQEEIDDLDRVLSLFRRFPLAERTEVPYTDDSKNHVESALTRLMALGIVSDYTADHALTFSVTTAESKQTAIAQRIHAYMAGYRLKHADAAMARLNALGAGSLREFVLSAARELVSFMYDIVERSRREGIAEMWAACREAVGDRDEGMRARLSRYLGSTDYTAAIAELLEERGAGLELLEAILSRVGSLQDADALRGELSHALLDYPDHPGLRALRGIAEARGASPDLRTVSENVAACLGFAQSRYGIDNQKVTQQLARAVDACHGIREDARHAIASGIVSASQDRVAGARSVVKHFGTRGGSAGIPALLIALNERMSGLLGSMHNGR